MNDRDGCIALNLVQGIGYNRFQLLSEYFGAPGQVFNHAAEEYAKLQLEVKKMKETIEKMLTKIFECTANQAKTNYSGLEMY